MYFTLNNIGYNYKQDSHFIISRPLGTSDYLFLFFPSDITIKLNDKWTSITPYSCIIYTPSTPQYYCNTQSGFINDWFHFSGTNVKNYLEELGLPLNTPFPVPRYDFIRALISNLGSEFICKDLFWEDHISSMLTSFFIQLAREYNQHTATHINPYQSQLLEKFKAIRMEILTHPEQPWDITTMCNLVGLSRSRFSVLYKSFFHCTPKEDLIHVRIKKAQYLLSTNNLSVSEVAYAVGYENIYHFNRQFKKIVGLSPGKWR